MHDDSDSTARRHDSLSDSPKEESPAPSSNDDIPASFQHFLKNYGLNSDTLSHSDQPESDGPSSENPLLAKAAQKLTLEGIGRYKVEKVLGEGGFGIVYLARDEELKRKVAIKIPQPDAIFTLGDIEAYLIEAQILACLDHPNIVPVFDVGRSENGLPFIVSKFIVGGNLAERHRASPFSIRQSAELVMQIAEALYYAHEHGLVHRDVKPVNILLEAGDKPYLVDFGLAMREEDYGKGFGYSGTPAYMSPEQANGEGHLVDGRSDLFSLGVILYELLSGEHPRRSPSLVNFLGVASDLEARPPRLINPAIPAELERITLRAIARRVSDRYDTGREFADDLRAWLDPVAVHGTDQAQTRIVPKGLRSFDSEDTDFFLGLLPGPRDRDGLPETLRFWKSRIEEKNPDKTFGVGVVYGPSGCGKSSLVKAGLLPRLSPSVIPVYLESTGRETETRLHNGLRRQFSSIPADRDLKETLSQLRRGNGVPPGKKVLIVLDQFEQWLHGRTGESDTRLIQSLRQCDGGHLQCLIMVRDDFWLAITRFMRELDSRILEGQNSSLVDLFDLDHARKVLAASGRAFGKLPGGDSTGPEQEAFLTQALNGLADNGKVIPVRLALFAEMMKDRAWNPSSLDEVGGTQGVGVTFLEETFAGSTASPERRLHQVAARGVLESLLPETGSDIKGHMRSEEELRLASGYADQPSDFEELMSILDGQLRLITPTDPEGMTAKTPAGETTAGRSRHFQLTHDYLVPSLRSWLTSKQKESREGRAELLLGELAAVWNSRPTSRRLPTFVQWVSIRWLTARKKWTPSQARMMSRAASYHSIRAGFLAVLIFAGFTTVIVSRQIEQERLLTNQAETLAVAILQSPPERAVQAVSEAGPLWPRVRMFLRDKSRLLAEQSRGRLNAEIALVADDRSHVEFLRKRLLDSTPEEARAIAKSLEPAKASLIGSMWEVVESPQSGAESRRLRAAVAQVEFDPDSFRWERVCPRLADDLVLENPIRLADWTAAFLRIKDKLRPRLMEIYRDPDINRRAERSIATTLLAEYADQSPEELAKLLLDADDRQFSVVYPRIKELKDKICPILTEVLEAKPAAEAEVELLSKRQANAAITLSRMEDSGEVLWPLLRHSADPRRRSYLIHRLGPYGISAEKIVTRLDAEPDVSARRALIQSLGEYGEKELPAERRAELLSGLRKRFGDAADPGEHAAVEWLLRKWGDSQWLERTSLAWARDPELRRKRKSEYLKRLAAGNQQAPVGWVVNSRGQTEIIIPGNQKFMIGPRVNELGRVAIENPAHERIIVRPFAIASKSVTVEEYRKFVPGHSPDDLVFLRLPDLPVGGVDWIRAVKYCNFLSEAEGILKDQWCYEIDGQKVRLKKGYLNLAGYRLPTETEMEFAIRAGAVTSHFYGESDELLPKYAWYQKNSAQKTWPVGLLKPNDYGLFDANGNVFTWCNESFNNYAATNGTPFADVEEPSDVDMAQFRVVRGGAFFYPASDMRSASRYGYAPGQVFNSFGIRPVRTIIPS